MLIHDTWNFMCFSCIGTWLHVCIGMYQYMIHTWYIHENSCRPRMSGRSGTSAERLRRNRAPSVCFLNEIVAGPAKLFDFRAWMFDDNLRAGAFSCVFAPPQIPASYGPSSAGLVDIKRTEGISAHFRLVCYSHGVSNRDWVHARSWKLDCWGACSTRFNRSRQGIPEWAARGVLSFACILSKVDRLDARIDRIAKQQFDETIAFVTGLFKRNARGSPVDSYIVPRRNRKNLSWL